MVRLVIVLYISIICSSSLYAQSISGQLPLLANQEIRLEEFSGLETIPVSKTTLDSKGHFQLPYSKSNLGMGFLISADEKPFMVILNGDEIEIAGEALSYIESMKIVKGDENIWFEKYAQEHPRREQALSAWGYLEKLYSADSLFAIQEVPSLAIQREKKRIKDEDAQFIDNLPEESYIRWFLPTRSLVSSVSTIAQYRTEEIPATIDVFRQLDYSDERLYKSGLFRDAIESHFWLLENSGLTLDGVFTEMKLSIDAMMEFLVTDEERLNEVTDYLFDLLERHSLFQASEYLALKVLNEVSCTIDNDLANQLETYRAMKKGNIAPDMVFNGEITATAKTEGFRKLSDFQSQYILVVFGASWCPKCKKELPEIVKHYANWKNQGVEVIFISLDESKEAYNNFVQGFPFFSTCDFKKWDSEMAKSFYVFGTPTMYLLDNQREILLRPNSVNQMDSWVDWYIVKGNK